MKTIFTTLVLLACLSQPATAYEFSSIFSTQLALLNMGRDIVPPTPPLPPAPEPEPNNYDTDNCTRGFRLFPRLFKRFTP